MIQLQVLNYILKNKDSSLITLNNLTEDYFSNYKSEFRFIKNHLDKYGVICDLETFLATFKSFNVLCVEETPSYLITALFDDFNTRKLTNTFNKIKTRLISGDLDGALKEYKLAGENLTKGISLQCVDLLRDTSRYDAYLERTKDFEKYYIPTGFKELDDVIGGFDREEELGVIVARTNYGKSWILLKCAVSACSKGLNVGIYSGEMSERKVGYRADTLIGHLNNKSLTHGNVSIQNEYKKYIDELPNKFKGSLKVLTPNMVDGSVTVDTLKAFIEKEKLDVLYVDQISLLEDQRKGKTPVEKLSNISKDLKLLQVMTRKPIILVCQQNRTVDENGSNTTQIAGSDRIGQDATLIVFIERKDDIMKLNLVKSRDSENGKSISYQVDLNTGTFNYIPDEKDVSNGQNNEEYENRYVDIEEEGENVF